MDHNYIISKLQSNREVFKMLLINLSRAEYLWKPKPDKWCLLEIICHLCDEDRDDFRTRLMQVLESPHLPLPPTDPLEWVKTRKYMEQNFETKLDNFLLERQMSIDWLLSLNEPNWESIHPHPKVGPLTAEFFLANWLAHDYLHIRQITRVNYEYLKFVSGQAWIMRGNGEG